MTTEPRPYRPDDLEGCKALMRAVYGDDATTADVWLWRHFGLSTEGQGMMVIEVEGRIVGMQPMELYRFSLDGEPLSGGVLTGVMVHPDFRRRGFFSALIRACTAKAFELGAAFVTTMPNDRSHPGFIKLGWVDPGQRTLMVRPLDVAGFVGRRTGSGVLGAMVGMLPQRVYDALWPRPRAKVGAIEEARSFDDDLDDLAAHVARGTKGLWMVRDRALATWRYLEHPKRPYTVLTLRREGLDGVAVLTTEARGGLQVGYVVDVLGRTEGDRRALLGAAVGRLRTMGAEVAMAVVAGQELVGDLFSVGFVEVPKRLSPKQFFTVYTPDPDRRAALGALAHIDGWVQTFGDWDTL